MGRMKRAVAGVLCVCMLVCMSACGSASKDVEESIAAIGDVDRASEDAIRFAREAYESLKDTEKAEVGNYDVLEAAEEQLEEMKVSEAEDLIGQIGDWQPGGNEQRDLQIQAAREAYNALTEAQQEKVENSGDLVKAEQKPFAEEMGFVFSEPRRSYTVPIDARLNDNAARPLVKNAEMPAPDVTRSEEDDEGYVVYTISWAGNVDFIFDRDEWHRNKSWTCVDVYLSNVYDYYTGLFLLNSDEVSSSTDDGLDVLQLTVEYQGKSFDIFVKGTEDLDWNSSYDFDSTWRPDRTSAEAVDTSVKVIPMEFTLMIRVPEDYDGLMIAIRGEEEEAPFYEDMGNFDCEQHGYTVEPPPVIYWSGNPEHWTFIRVDDMVEN